MEASSSTADRLCAAARACCNAEGDIESVVKFVDILRTPLKIVKREKEWQFECEALLKQASSLMDPSIPSGKELMDHVGGELPKVVVQYVGVSKSCQESSARLIQGLAMAFDPAREMFTAIFEAINMYSKPHTLHLCPSLLRGLSIVSVPLLCACGPVFPRITRRTTEFFKEAVPGLIEVGRVAGQDEVDIFNDDPKEINNDSFNPERFLISRDYMEENIQDKVINELIYLAKVIKGICDGGKEMQRLRDILGIFTLQLLSIACGALSDSNTTLSDVFLELLELLSFSSLSFSILVSITEVDKILDVVFDEEDLKAQENRLEAKRGAALAVYWGMQKEELDDSTKELAVLKERFKTPGLQMVLDIIGLASTLLVHVSCTQEMALKHKGLILMTSILEVHHMSSNNGDTSQPDGALDLSMQIRPALQRLQDVIVYIPSPMLRQQAYGILIKIIKQALPIQARFATLYGLISSSGHPALVSLLLTSVKDEVLKSWPPNEGGQKLGQDVGIEVSSPVSPFTTQEVLEFIQCVLRTKDGNLAELPTNLDAVVSALNLYRFLLIKESSGKTNYTQVLSAEQLVKGRTYWLLPLREQILRVQSMLEAAGPDTDHDVQLGMDLLKSVFYRCLEIVESLLASLPN